MHFIGGHAILWHGQISVCNCADQLTISFDVSVCAFRIVVCDAFEQHCEPKIHFSSGTIKLNQIKSKYQVKSHITHFLSIFLIIYLPLMIKTTRVS